jgi:hypothetical protein
VLGINDCNLQKDLLKIRNITLPNCVDLCKANENANIQNNQMKPENVNKINYKTNNVKIAMCKFCGQRHEWNKDKCPAYNKICSKCKNKNQLINISQEMLIK